MIDTPTAKAGGFLFLHHCIGKYLTVLQCSRCPHIFILFPHALRTVLSFMPTAAAVLFQNIDACIRIPVSELYRTPGHSQIRMQIFNSGFRRPQELAGLAADTSLRDLRLTLYTTQLYIPASRKLLLTKHWLSTLPVYGSGSFPLHADSMVTVGFHTPALLTVSAGNHFDSLLFHVLWQLESSRFIPVMGSFLSSGKSALFLSKFSHRAFQISGIRYCISVASQNRTF